MAERNRFVLLHHVLREGAHWDLMLEAGDALITWHIAEDPALLAADRPVSVRQIRDHRRAYLDYEGPVSGDRGHVTRSDAGEYELIERRENVWDLRLTGAILNGRYRLEKGPSGCWAARRLVSHGSGSMPSTSAPG